MHYVDWLRKVSRISDRRILFLFFIFGPLPAITLFINQDFTFFYQKNVPESVLWACGYGLHHPADISAPLQAFLSGEVHHLDCSSLGAVQIAGPAGSFYQLQPAITWSTAILWRLFGVSYQSLSPLLFVLYGAYASGTYALARLFLDRTPAVTAAVFLAAAPLSVSMVLELRDFSKAPFFIWSLVFLLKAIRASDFRYCSLYAALSGIAIGMGYGFRTDLIILLPVGAVILAIGARAVCGAPSAVLRYAGIVAPAVFALSFLVMSAPVWTQMNIATIGGTFIMQGATEPFRIAAGLRPAGYAVGWAYLDELTLAGIAAEQRLLNPDWDTLERTAAPYYDVSRAVTQSTADLSRWADVFAADFFAQAIKSAGWILGFPAFLVRTEVLRQLPPPALLSPTRLTLGVYSLLGHSWIIYWGMLGAAALLLRSFARSRREALCLLLLFGFLVSYPGIQFAPRHFFHLEFVWVIGTLALLTGGPWLRREWHRLPAFLTYSGAFVLLVGTAYMVANEYQKRTLAAEMERLLALPREPVTTTPVLLGNGDRFFAVDVPGRYRDLVADRADAMRSNLVIRGQKWDVRAAADRLLVDVSGHSCPFEKVTVLVKYTHTPLTWQPLDAELALLETPRSGTASLLFPAFYRPTQSFHGVQVPKAFSDCDIAISRITGAGRLPLVLTANVEGSNILGPLYKAIGTYDRPVDQTAVARSATGGP